MGVNEYFNEYHVNNEISENSLFKNWHRQSAQHTCRYVSPV